MKITLTKAQVRTMLLAIHSAQLWERYRFETSCMDKATTRGHKRDMARLQRLADALSANTQRVTSAP